MLITSHNLSINRYLSIVKTYQNNKEENRPHKYQIINSNSQLKPHTGTNIYLNAVTHNFLNFLERPLIYNDLCQIEMWIKSEEHHED